MASTTEDEKHVSDVSEEEGSEESKQSTMSPSKQKSAMLGKTLQTRSKLEFCGKLKFTQEENTQELNAEVNDSKLEMEGDSDAKITAVSLQNVPVQPLKLFKQITSKRLT